jgi:hypothetical protein
MSAIRRFRANGDDRFRGVSFYCEVEDNNEYALCKLRIDGEGIYYYHPHSQILTPNENEGTIASFDSFMSMEELQSLFEALTRVGYVYDQEEAFRFKISKRGKKIIIEPN